MSASFTREAVIAASTKRGSLTGGKRDVPVIYLVSIQCTPLYPVSAQTALRAGLDTPLDVLQTFTESSDIVEGDILVVGAKEYPIKAVLNYPMRTGAYKQLILEDLKR